MKIFTASLAAPDGTILGIGMGATVEEAHKAAQAEYLLTLYALIKYGHPSCTPQDRKSHA